MYLNLNRSIDELYYEKYDNVAVMFASLTDYKLGLEGDADMSDKFVLSILDEVISDFDRVIINNSINVKVNAYFNYYLHKPIVFCAVAPNRNIGS